MRNDLVEPWAIRNLRKNVRESMQSHGEQVILLHVYRANHDQGAVPRCPACYNDAYRASDNPACTVCYGTSFAGGVQSVLRCWAMFTTTDDNEKRTKKGESITDVRQVQLEPGLEVAQHDYVVRVKKWSPDNRPLELAGRYKLGSVSDEALRTGAQFGQDDADRVGQKASVSLMQAKHVIYEFPIPPEPVPAADDVPAPWVRTPVWFYGEGPPTRYNTTGSEFGDKYLDVLTDTEYTLAADNVEWSPGG